MRGQAPKGGKRRKVDWASLPPEARAKKDYGMRKSGSYAMYKIIPPGTSDSLTIRGSSWAAANPAQKAVRRASGYYGPGDYKSALRYGARGLGALSGAAMGYMGGGGMAGIGAGMQSEGVV